MDPPTPVPYPFNSMQNPLYDSYNPPHTPKGHRGAGVLFGSSPLSPRYSDLEPPPMLSAFKSFASSLLGGSGAGSLPRNDSGAALANIGDESTPAATLKPDACLPRSADADTSSFTPRRLPSWDSEAFKSSFGRLVDPPPLSPTALLPRRIVDAEPDHLSLGSSSTSSFASSAEGQGAVPSQALGFSSSYHPAPPTFKLFQPTFGNRQQQQLADLYDDVTAVTAAYQDEGAFKESSPTPTASDGGVEESGDSVATDTAVVSHLPWIRPVNFLSPHAPPPSESEYSMPSITPISRSPSLYQVPSASIEPFEEEAVRFDEEELRFDEEGDVVPFDNDEEEVVLFEEEEEQEQEEKEEQEEEQQEQEEQEGAAVEKPQSHKSKPKPINRKAAKKARSRKNRKIDEDYQHEIPESTESTDLVADDDEAGEQVARLNNKRTFKVALWE
ncbi:hypothetical protein Q8F55_004283 [Vanrija albida]|uniref:Uncharacterized protein n=1 Tax=Vanrija albida TaxID=181172 RepID=A0ABR3Q6L6_9TREE